MYKSYHPMMKRAKKPLTIYETRTNLSKLLRRVERGEEVLVARGSKVIARIVPATLPDGPRTPGSAKGRFVSDADFNAPLPENFMGAFK